MIALMNTTPYANLNPDLILSAVESLGFQCSGGLLALNSFENRVYQVSMEDSPPLIVKFYRPERWSNETILEEHQFALELVEHELPVVAPWQDAAKQTLHNYDEFRFSVYPRVGGRPLELDRYDQLEWMGRFIGRLHAVGAVRPFKHRPTLGVDNYGWASFAYLKENHFFPDYLESQFADCIEPMLEKIKIIFQNAGSLQFIRVHGDIHPGNVLWSEAGPHIVDLDDCLMAPAIQDIWMMLSGDEFQVRHQLECILEGYEEFHHFNRKEIYLIEALRALRMLYYSAWLARRWEDPAFPINFPWFNTAHYWQDQLANFREQLDILVAL